MTNGRNLSTKRQSAVVTAAYTYDDRYSVSLAGSWSGTAYLEEGSRFHFYPAVNAAWIATGEDFLKDARNLDYWKVFASAGISGWDGNMSHELWRQSYGGENAGSYYFTTNVSQYWGDAEGTLPVENLVPEKSRKITLGTELKAFKDRLGVYAEGFWEERSNILVSASSAVSGILGIGTSYECAGENLYRGLDASVTWNDRRGDFSYGLYGNIAYLSTEVVNENQEYQEYDYLYHAGNPVGQKYGLEVIGFFHDQMDINNSPSQSFSTVRPGDIKYKDISGPDGVPDGRITPEYDKTIIGSNIPRYTYSFRGDFGWKNLDFSFVIQGVGKCDGYLTGSARHAFQDMAAYPQKIHLQRYNVVSNPDPNAPYPRLTYNTSFNQSTFSTYWLEDASYLRLKNVQIGYTFPKKWMKKARIENLRVYFSGDNLLTVSDFFYAYDPETPVSSGGYYPQVKTFVVGLNITFE